MIDGIPGDDREPILRTHLILHLVSHNDAAKTGAHNDDFRHSVSPS